MDGTEIADKRQKIMEIKERYSGNCLFIKRVPKKTKQQFEAWASEEFDNDWGFALKWLMDFKEGIIGSQTEVLLQKVAVLEQEVAQLKDVQPAVEEPKKKVIRSLGGTVIAERKVE